TDLVQLHDRRSALCSSIILCSGYRNRGVMADPLVHTYKVKIAVPNPAHRLLPGMLCNVVIDNPVSMEGVVVPIGCLLADENGRQYLFVADTIDNVALRRDVKPGWLVKTGVQIDSGLQAGESIVTFGHQKLNDRFPIIRTR
ncbi:hypothetical protein KKH18_05250, partial [bacterium]|nr:hypothetical protein [bacterium]